MANSSSGFRGNKAALPSKPCQRCGLAMSWRRRWARHWADVKYCSDACRRGAKPPPAGRQVPPVDPHG